jgi:CelD/BcsL family acetyltransferase involved in cellulose biosynthesis
MYGMPVRLLESIANEHTPRFGSIITQRVEDIWLAIWSHLRANDRHWDVLKLRQLPPGATALRELPRLAAEAGYPTGLWHSAQSPHVVITGTWNQYLSSLNSKHRSNLRNRFKRLGALGEVSHEVFGSTEHLDEAFHLEGAAWKADAKTAIDSRPEIGRFYTQFAKRAESRGWLRLHFLNVGGRRIACQYSIRYHDKLYLLKPGYDPEFGKYSPSNLLCARVLEEAFDNGIKEFDFLGESDPWKLDWTTQLRPHEWFFVFGNTALGHLLHRVKFSIAPRFQERLAAGMRALVSTAKPFGV